MADVFVYGIDSDQSVEKLVVKGIMNDLTITSSGTEQTLPGQTSCSQNADSGVADVSTKVSLTVRGSAVSQTNLETITGTIVAVSINAETSCGGSRQPVAYSFSLKVNSAAVTAKARDWWDVKIDGTIVWA